MGFLDRLIMVLVPMLLSLSVHEYAHARSAYALGDDTAARMGRMSLNPGVHIDMFGTIILPVISVLSNATFFFGWAKPVPINPVNFTRKISMKRGMLISAAAGPLSNIAFAFVLAVLFKILTVSGAVDFPMIATLPGQSESYMSMTGVEIPAVYRLIGTTFVINVVLAIFNFIPVPPLDGSRVLAGLLPDSAGRKLAWLERNPVFVIAMFSLLIFGGFRFLQGPVMGIMFGLMKITGNV